MGGEAVHLAFCVTLCLNGEYAIHVGEQVVMSYVFIGLGANLTPVGYLNPRDGCEAALVALREEGVFSSRFQIGMKRHLYLSLTNHGI